MGFMDVIDALDEILDDDEEFNPDFRVVNKTGYDIHELYVSESNNDEWGEDVLDEDILEDDAYVNVAFETNSRQRWWDIRVVDEDEDEAVFPKIDLSRVSKVTLCYNDDGEPYAECR